MAEVTDFDFKFYQKIERGAKKQLKVETVERLGKPFGLAAWQLLAPNPIFRRAKVKVPKARTPAPKGPRAKWKGIKK